MGFFSWDCKSCGHPMLSRHAADDFNRWMTQVVVMFKDGTRLIGEYDGYGGIDGLSVYSGHFGDEPEPCCYHKACWEKEGRPEYNGPSESSEDQGYFFDDGDHDMLEPT